MATVPLRSLIDSIETLTPRAESALPDLATPIGGVQYDSRRVRAGDLFVCVRGGTSDGHAFAEKAWEMGARVVVGERPLEQIRGPYLRVSDSRAALALLAAAAAGQVSRRMVLVGITGTNGKSSITWMLQRTWEHAGIPAAVVGTLGVGRPPALRAIGFTTPEAPELQQALRSLYAEGTRAAALEVSSHGLALRRSFGTRFRAVVFTNLSVDHLDFHGTMEEYAAAKARLFRAGERGPEEPAGIAIVNGEDPWLPRILDGSTDEVVRYGRGSDMDVRPVELRMGMDGIHMAIAHRTGQTELHSPLLGEFQVDNLLAAFATATALGMDPEAAASGLGSLAGIPGRMERVDRGQPFVVVVDYSHTPDSLERALRSLRPFTSGRLLVVFGCGGERDRGKRPEMGRVAARGADLIYLTDDNPRREDPAFIRSEVRAGLVELGKPFVEDGDRTAAIRAAFLAAKAGDVVLIAGKGAETTQIRGETAVPFDDRLVAGELLGSLGHSARREEIGSDPSAARATPRWTLEQAARAAGGRLSLRDADPSVAELSFARAQVSIDSRRLRPGDFFVALRGERFDGNEYVPTVAAAGALGALVERESELDAFPQIVVRDCLEALQRWAAWQREQFGAKPLLGLTGSSGKTTAKDLVSHLLRGLGAVHATRGNENNHVGVALTLLGLDARHHAAVVEMGMNHAGEIRQLTGLARPTAALITSIGRAHVGYLGSREAILAAKLEIAEGLSSPDAPLVLAHDPWVFERLPEAIRRRRLVTFGLDPAADWHPEGPIDWTLRGTRFRVRGAERFVPLLGEGGLLSSLAALAGVDALGFDAGALAPRLESAPRHAMRMEPREHDGVTWLLDCYNASPESTRISVEFAAQVPHPGRRLCVLGALGELGAQSAAIHAELGALVRGFDRAFFVGADAAPARDAYPGPAGSATFHETTEAAAEVVAREVRPGDLVLLKGSRRMALEHIFTRVTGLSGNH